MNDNFVVLLDKSFLNLLLQNSLLIVKTGVWYNSFKLSS